MTLRAASLLLLSAILLVATAACGSDAPTNTTRRSASASATEVPDLRPTVDPSERPLTQQESRFVADLRQARDAPAPDSARAVEALGKLPGPLSESEVRALKGVFATFDRLLGEWRDRPAPSDRLRSLRRLWLASLVQCASGGRHLVAWIESGDRAHLGLGAKMLDKGERSGDRVTGELERLEALGSE